MRRIAFFALILLLSAALVQASVPRTMSYQGVLRDTDGNIVADDSYSLEFNIYDAEDGETPLWTETQSVDVVDGLFDVTLGVVTPLSIGFDTQYWLGISIESEPELAERVALAAAPYAFRAAVADAATQTALKFGKFECNNDYALLAECNGVQLLQNGARNLFRIHSNIGDASGCYAYYLDGVQVSKAALYSGTNYDFTIPFGGQPYHAEVILARPWGGGAAARVDIYYENTRCGGIWTSSQ
jgi:hypothetical protein